jgi:excisionase family DNA binding protein
MMWKRCDVRLHYFPLLADHKRRLDSKPKVIHRWVTRAVSRPERHADIGVHVATDNVSSRKPPQPVYLVPEPLIDSEEAAAIIKIHPKTLQRLARQKLIRGVRIGTHWRFRASEIEAWYQQKIAN